MSRASCTQEAAVTKAARTNAWSESLATHAAGCAVCREVLETARWMQALARDRGEDSQPPDASLVWWRMQLADRRAKAEKTRTVLEWAEIVSGAIVPLGLAGWATWNWFAIQGAAASLMIDLAPQFPLAVLSLSALVPALLVLGAISLVYPLVARE